MPPSWSAILNSASGTSRVLTDLGSRFATCSYRTSANAGFDTMETALRMPGGPFKDPKVSLDMAGYIIRNWIGYQGKVFIEGSLGWCGRVSKIIVGNVDKKGMCSITLNWKGHIYDLERERPQLDAAYSDEFATYSASSLLKAIVDQLPSNCPIAKSYTNVAETAISIGAVPMSVQDTSLSVILNQLRGASSSGVEYTLLVWDPADGPYLIPIGVGPTKYRMLMSDSPGTTIVYNLDELVTDCVALFSDVDNVADATEWKESIIGPTLNNGLRSYRAISVDALSIDGATAARDAFLTLHENPIGINGSFRAVDYISNDDGANQILAGLVRAGDIVRIADLLPFDPLMTKLGRSRAIKSTTYDVFTGELTVSLDDREIRSRENERMTTLRTLSRALEPGLAHNTIIDYYEEFDTPVTVTSNNNIRVNDESIPFNLNKSGKISIRIVVTVRDSGTSSSDCTWQIGFRLDGEDWDETDEEQKSDALLKGGIDVLNGTTSLQGSPKPKHVSAGPHTLDVYVRDNAGSYVIPTLRVFGTT